MFFYFNPAKVLLFKQIKILLNDIRETKKIERQVLCNNERNKRQYEHELKVFQKKKINK